jgi:hypothetical protein
MKEKSPAFQFYPKDFLSDSTAMIMPSEARGIYITLLCHDWINDGIPDHHGNLMALGGWNWTEIDNSGLRDPDEFQRILEFILPAFVPHPAKPDTLTNRRLMKERERQEQNREDKKKAGEKGAKARWQNHNPANGKAITEDASSSSSSSSSSTSLKPIKKGDDKKPNSRANFEAIWAHYPEKKGKEKAFTHFKAQIKTAQDLWNVNVALKTYITDMARVRSNGHPDRAWLHGDTFFNKRWKDYIDYKPPPKKTADGIPAVRELAKDELKAKIYKQMEYLCKAKLQKANAISGILWQSVGFIWRLENRYWNMSSALARIH